VPAQGGRGDVTIEDERQRAVRPRGGVVEFLVEFDIGVPDGTPESAAPAGAIYETYLVG
jgi:hypothetical protein